MSARQAENELEFLKTAPIDKWWFKVKEPSESFTKLFNSLIDKHLFHIKLIRFMPGSGLLSVGQVTEIDEEGMWFLSHLFSNWQEMYERAVPPWDRKHTKQGEPEQQANICAECKDELHEEDAYFDCVHCGKSVCSLCWNDHQKIHWQEQEKKCCECGVDEFNDLFYCGTCNKRVCSGCDGIHQNTHKVNCTHCAKPVYRDITNECPDCHKLICVSCMPEHKKMHRYQSEQEPNMCAHCGMGIFPGTDVTCSICWKRFHSGCHHAFHAETHAPKHVNARTTFHFDNIKMNWRIDEEVLNSLRDTMAWANSDEAKQQAEKLKRQQEEAERKARAREQAQRMYEKQQRDQEEFYKNLFGNMGHFSFKNNRNRTYTHTWDFGHWESDDDHQNAHCDPGSASSTLEAAFNHLGLSTRATVQEVKHAFRRKAKEAHPDTGGSDAAFKELNEAYQKALAEAQRNER